MVKLGNTIFSTQNFLNNPNFNYGEFATIKEKAGLSWKKLSGS
mgnify:CR=1 FL=1